MNITPHFNTLYYGDCLDIMAEFDDNYVDLICLDPPFNSNRKYNQIFRGSGLRDIDPQLKAFDDTWEWNADSADRVQRVKSAIANPASKVIEAFEICIPASQMLSYTSYMAERLFQMHRILKDTGSIYLHCDPFASHYLKLLLDAIFGRNNFRNEIVWHYPSMSRAQKWFPRKNDIIFFYAVSGEYTFNADDERVREQYAESTKQRAIYGRAGFTRKQGEPNYLKSNTKLADTVWKIPHIKSKKEHMGYPSQKPLALYERIISASSNPGDIVLDPFAGCGTTIEAARKLNRKAIGIDILPFALNLINDHRLKPNGMQPMRLDGVPVDRTTAYQLADENPYKFQDWAISLIHGFASNEKKTADDGIDGFGIFRDEPDNMDRKAILIQVTGAKGQQKSKYERLQATIRNHNAAMGILITLNKQQGWQHTLPPIKMGVTEYPPLQCISIDEYYQHNKKWNTILTLPALTNPWTGKPIDPLIVDAMFDTVDE